MTTDPDTGLVNALMLSSAICVAIPTGRALLRVIWARHLDARADRWARTLPNLDKQARQTLQSEIERDKGRAGDLIEFAALTPFWVIALALIGLAFGIAARVVAFW